MAHYIVLLFVLLSVVGAPLIASAGECSRYETYHLQSRHFGGGNPDAFENNVGFGRRWYTDHSMWRAGIFVNSQGTISPYISPEWCLGGIRSLSVTTGIGIAAGYPDDTALTELGILPMPTLTATLDRCIPLPYTSRSLSCMATTVPIGGGNGVTLFSVAQPISDNTTQNMHRISFSTAASSDDIVRVRYEIRY